MKNYNFYKNDILIASFDTKEEMINSDFFTKTAIKNKTKEFLKKLRKEYDNLSTVAIAKLINTILLR